MEHLVLVDKEQFPPIPFPLIGEQWDGGLFLDYCQRRDYDASTHRFGGETEIQLEESYGFYQTWLYLGILADPFFCSDVNERFLWYDESSDINFLTTTDLPDVIKAWQDALASMSLPDRVGAILHARKCIETALHEIHEVNVPSARDFIWEDESPDTSQTSQNVRLAIALLCDALAQTVSSVITEDLEVQIDKYNSKYARSEADEITYPPHPAFRFRLGGSLDAAMDRALFCPVEKAGFNDAPTSFLCYLLSLPETNRFEGQHDNCTRTSCVGNNIDEKTYVTRHVSDDCDCEHDGPDIEAVKECLKEGQIPILVVNIVDGEYQGMKVKPHKVEKASIWRRNQGKSGFAKVQEYVALSHVWSDGLGNPFANTLPRCQLRRLAYYINYTMNDGKSRGLAESFDRMLSSGKTNFAKRNGTVWEQDGTFTCAFWNDTMCVPLIDEYRKMAIKSMNQVYRQARYVMVLDQCLAIHNYTTDEELMARVVLSNWMRRVWTLQEAVLGMEKLAFCTKDLVVDHSDIVERLRLEVVSGRSPIRNSVCENVAVLGDDAFQSFAGAVAIMDYNKGFSLSSFVSSKGEKALQEGLYRQFLESLWIVISRRATTKEEDRVLVACNILCKDVGKVLKGKGHTGRMVGLLSQFEEVPADVIFKTGERVPVEGFRWAVHNFKVSSWGKVDLERPGVVTPQGLMVQFSGLILPSKPSESAFPLIIESGGKSEYYVVNCSYARNAGEMLSQEDWDEVTGTDRQLAIIRSDQAAFTHTVPLKDGRVAPCRVFRSILVSIKEERKGTVYCQYETYIYLLRPPGLEYEDLVDTTHPTITATDIRPVSQRWCVG